MPTRLPRLRYESDSLRRYSNVLQNEVSADMAAARNHLSQMEWATPEQQRAISPNVEASMASIRHLESSVGSISSALSRTDAALQSTMNSRRNAFNRFPNSALNIQASRLIRGAFLTIIRFPRSSPLVSDVISSLNNRFGGNN